MLSIYSYLIGDLFFLAVWVLLFFLRRDLRKEMITMSLITGFMGPFSEFWYFRDYWRPPLVWQFHSLIGGLEDVLFGFAIGGIAAVIYEEVLGKRLIKRGRTHNLLFVLFFFLIFICMLVFNYVLALNSIFASSLAFIIFSVIMLALRPDLTKDALLSGLFVSVVMFVIYWFYLPPFLEYADQIYLPNNEKWGFWILGRVPFTEMVWGFCWGMVGGPLYEFWKGYQLKKGG